MEQFLLEIEKALDSGLYQIALQAALTLPDICAALMSSNGKTSKEKYTAWYNTYAKQPDDYLSADDCYYYRCSYVHQGRSTHERASYSRIMFTPPNANGVITHNCVLFGALNVDIQIFCRGLTNSVRSWQKQFENNPNYIANCKNLIKYYPDGFSGYISGLPVIT